jgi:hypothetical protein
VVGRLRLKLYSVEPDLKSVDSERIVAIHFVRLETIMQINSTDISLKALKQSGRWLNASAANIYSQTGEDGVVAKALSILPATNKWCVEFGAWDGKHLSNTFNLVENCQYKVILIEGDENKYRKLCAGYPFQERGNFINQFVGWTEIDGLDSILEGYPIPSDFDLLSIDVDGNDFHIWKAVKIFRPKLVLIEFNPTSSNRFEYVQPADPKCNQSSSPAALVRLAKEKGYELICVTGVNLLFVDKKFYPLFEIPDNSLTVMRDEDEVTSLYFGFDGSLIVDGPAELRWHGGKLQIPQPLPKFLRRYPPAYTKLQSSLFRLRNLLRKLTA